MKIKGRIVSRRDKLKAESTALSYTDQSSILFGEIIPLYSKNHRKKKIFSRGKMKTFSTLKANGTVITNIP